MTSKQYRSLRNYLQGIVCGVNIDSPEYKNLCKRIMIVHEKIYSVGVKPMKDTKVCPLCDEEWDEQFMMRGTSRKVETDSNNNTVVTTLTVDICTECFEEYKITEDAYDGEVDLVEVAGRIYEFNDQ